MGENPIRQVNRDLVSPTEVGKAGTTVVSSAKNRRHVLPKDLPNAIKHLDDQELDRLLAATLAEVKMRGRFPSSNQTAERSTFPVRRSARGQKNEEATVSSTRGQINAVRAAIKAGGQAIANRSSVRLVARGRTEGVSY